MVGQSAAASGPVDVGERSALLDSLRGWALLGILVANLMTFSGWVFVADPERGRLLLSGLDDISELLLEWLVIGKFYALFSLLFGIGFAIQIGRLEQRGAGAGRYLMRLAVLFLIGVAHIMLLWMGDIVALYALMGGFLLLFRKASDRALLIGAVLMWLFPIAWAAARIFGGLDPSGPLFGMAFQMIAATGIDMHGGPLGHYQSPSFLQHLLAHRAEAMIRLADLVYQMRFTKVLGMFLVGLWIGRRAIHADPAAFRPLLRRAARLGIGLGLPLSLAKAVLSMWPDETRAIAFAGEVFYCLGTPTLALGYAAAFTLLWLGARRRLAEVAAPAGRMALTNYLMQSVIQSVIFLGWGLALTGTLGLVFVFPFAAAVFALQLAYSRWWLKRYRFGPVEWLWRSLTYGRVQPMRLQPVRSS